MSLVDKLLGKRQRSANNLSLEIETQTAAVKASQALRQDTALKRKAAIENFDDDAHKAADEAIAAAERDIERRENALAELREAHSERVEIELREAFRCEMREAAARAKKLDTQFANEYPVAAELIARFARELYAESYKRECLRKRARELGEPAPDYDLRFGGFELAIGDLPSIDRPAFIHQSYAGVIKL